MNTWWWTTQLMADGHIFNGPEWRCSDCRIRVVDLLADRPRCESPNNDDEFVFVGGPFDGEWHRESAIRVLIPLPYGPPTAIDPDDDRTTIDARSYASVLYERSRMKTKGLIRYEFRP